MKDECEKYRAQLIETIVEFDDELMAMFLDGKEPDMLSLKKALRHATITNKIFPVYPGSSLRNKGVQPMLDAVVDFLPSPLDRKVIHGTKPESEEEEIRQADPAEALSMLAFKIQADPHVGRLTYVRIYSGTLKSGSYIYNSSKRERERVGRLVLMHANQREEIEVAKAGEIVAVVGLKATKTGDTLCEETKPIILESINFPDPVISVAIEPKTKV
jgi:elongation factor G